MFNYVRPINKYCDYDFSGIVSSTSIEVLSEM